MNSHLSTKPVLYSPDVEEIDKNEPQLEQALTEQMLSIAYKTYDDSGHAIRSVHAKSHGLLQAEFEVLDGLPPELAQGIFAEPATHEAVVRLSTVPGDILPDDVSTPRGFALKLIDVDGQRLPGSEQSFNQDFILVNGKEFNASSAKAFLGSLAGLAATTDRMEGTKRVLSKVMRGVEAALEAVGSESPTLKSMGGNPPRHVLADAFYGQLPIRYGQYIAKFAVVPVSENLKALDSVKMDLAHDEDVLRHAVQEFFETETAVWEFRVQLCTDLEEMPVESDKAWDEDKSPFMPVARITVKPQAAWSQERSEAGDDGIHFSPWNGIAEHQPLGQLMRMSKLAYERSSAFRSERNAIPVTEPQVCPFAHGTVGASGGVSYPHLPM